MEKKEQDKIIRKLMRAMVLLEDALTPLDLPEKDICYARDLHDAVQVLYFKKKVYDSSFQEELASDAQEGKEAYMDFEEAKTCLLVRISNLTEIFLSNGLVTRF